MRRHRTDNQDVDKMMTRRALILGAGGAGVFSILAARLYYLQVVRAEDYVGFAQDNQFNFRIDIPERGRILDRNGVVLATNRQDPYVMLVPEQTSSLSVTLNDLGKLIDLPEGTQDRIQTHIDRHPDFVPVLVKEHLNWEEFSLVNSNVFNLPGIVPAVGRVRTYPFAETFSHVIGYVGSPSPEDVERDNDQLLRQPSFKIGKAGIEENQDRKLRGQSGQIKVEVNAMGRVIQEWPLPNQSAKAGEDVYLTLDADLQNFAAKQFGEQSGAIAVVDVITGELRTLLSMPGFDPNLFVEGLSQAQMDVFQNDERKPLYSKVLLGVYPPASTFKMAVSLAALDAGEISPNERITCNGKVHLGGRDFHCWRPKGHGRLNLEEALKYSCDVYYYELAARIGIDRIKDAAFRLGLGQPHLIGIRGQSSGLLPDDAWKRERFNDGWRQGDTLNVGIGQGFTLVTPLQMAIMTARLANGKFKISPSLIVGQETPPPEPLGFRPEHVEMVQMAMRAVCEEPGGTAYRPGALGFAGVEMAGKTGTAQVRIISTAERRTGVVDNSELPWKLRDHKMFVAYAPFDKPRYAVATVVEHGSATPTIAIDISRAVLSEALRRDGYGGPQADEI